MLTLINHIIDTHLIEDVKYTILQTYINIQLKALQTLIEHTVKSYKIIGIISITINKDYSKFAEFQLWLLKYTMCLFCDESAYNDDGHVIVKYNYELYNTIWINPLAIHRKCFYAHFNINF
jgi:hypothetical protein